MSNDEVLTTKTADQLDLQALHRGRERCVGLHFAEVFSQFVEQFGRNTREIVDEVERVLNLVCDPRGQLAKRGSFCLWTDPV